MIWGLHKIPWLKERVEQRTDEEWVKSNVCPDCREEGFYEGPSGGASQNIICANHACQARFNVTPFGIDRVGDSKLSLLEKEVSKHKEGNNE
jgi:hypothetical protein